MKNRHFPKERGKLHALLDKKEQDLIDLQDELKDLRAAVTEADNTAIYTTAAAFSVDADLLGELLSYIKDGRMVPAELAAKLTPVPVQGKPEEKEENKKNAPDDKTEI